MSLKTKKELLVWEACDELFERKEIPTIKLVGDILEENDHKRGSNRDLATYIRNWKEKNLETATNNKTEKLSDPLQEALLSLRNEIKTEAKEEIGQIQLECEEKLANAAESVAKAEEQAEKLNQENISVKRENEHLLTEIDLKEELVTEQRIASNAILEQTKAKEQEFELKEESSKSKISLLEKTYDSLLEEYNAQHNSWQTEIKSTLTEKEQFSVNLEHSLKEIKELNKENKEQSTEIKKLSEEKEQLISTIKVLEESKASLMQQLSLIENNYNKQINTLTNHFSNLENNLIKQQDLLTKDLDTKIKELNKVSDKKTTELEERLASFNQVIITSNKLNEKIEKHLIKKIN